MPTNLASTDAVLSATKTLSTPRPVVNTTLTATSRVGSFPPPSIHASPAYANVLQEPLTTSSVTPRPGSANATSCPSAAATLPPCRARRRTRPPGTRSTTATSTGSPASILPARCTLVGLGVCLPVSSSKIPSCRTSSTPRAGAPWQRGPHRSTMSTITRVLERIPRRESTSLPSLVLLASPRFLAAVGTAGLIPRIKSRWWAGRFAHGC